MGVVTQEQTRTKWQCCCSGCQYSRSRCATVDPWERHRPCRLCSVVRQKAPQREAARMCVDRCHKSSPGHGAKYIRFSRGWFRVLKVASKIWVLEQTQSKMLSCVSHKTILWVFTCVVNVWNQTSWTSVTSSLSIWWQIEHVCSLNKECQVCHFVPNTSILREFASILLTVLQLIQVPPAWMDDPQSKDMTHCNNCSVFLFGSSQYLSSHCWACCRTTQPSSREVLATLEILLLL